MKKSIGKWMSKSLSVTLAGIVLSCSVLASGATGMPLNMTVHAAEENGATQLYVSLDGDDSAAGTIDAPFRTLKAARGKIREMKKAGLPSGGVTVNIRGGEYPLLEESFTLSEEDSGTADSPIIWRAYPGEEVKFVGNIIVSGGKFVSVEEQAIRDRLQPEVQDKVLVYDLAKENGLTNFAPIPKNGYGWPAKAGAMAVTVDGESQTLSRFPNEGFINISSIQKTGFVPRDHQLNPDGSCPQCTKEKGNGQRIPCDYTEADYLTKCDGGIFTTNNADVVNRFPLWQQETDIWTFGYFCWDWADDHCAIKSIEKTDAGVKMETRQPTRYGFKGGGRRFYVYNMLCEIDQPGEWYLDRDNAKLYLYPTKDISASNVELAMQTKPLVTMENVDYVDWQGVTFSKSNGHGIVMKNCENCEIAGCTFSDLGQRAVFMGNPDYVDADVNLGAEGGSNNTVRSCDITRTGQGGIFLGGGNRYELTPGNNKVENCDISDFATIKRTYSPAVELFGCGNSVVRNHIYDAPHTAIQFKGNNMLIEGNDIHNVCYETADVGAIYSVRRWSWQGNVVQNNFIHDLVNTGGIGSAAVYVDDLGSGVTMKENLLVNIPGYTTLFGGGRDNVITNNIQINYGNGKGFQYDNRGLGWAWYHAAGPDGECYGELDALRKHPDYNKALWDETYPALADIDLETVENRTEKGEGYKNWYKEAAKPAGATIEKNILVGVANPYGNVSGDVKRYAAKYDEETNVSLPEGTDIGFADADAFDFTVLKDSEIKKMMGDEHFKVEEMGLYEDDFRTLAKAELAAPELTAPADDATEISASNGVRFTWNPVENAGSYTVEIAADADFTNVVKKESTDQTEISILGLDKATTYYWRVTARERKVNGASNVSAVRSFTTSEKDDGSFFEGFRDFDEWTEVFKTVSNTTSKAHSGRYSFELNQNQEVVQKRFGTHHNDVMSVWLYDNMNKGNGAAGMAKVSRVEENGNIPWIGAGVSVATKGLYKDHYVVRDGGDWIETDIERTEGWHELTFDYTNKETCIVSIDGKKVHEFKDAPYYDSVELGDFWDHSGYPGDVSGMLFDDVKVGEPVVQENILSITVPEKDIIVNIDKTYQLEPIVETDPDVNVELAYTSNEYEVAKVDEKTGLIQPVRKGKTVVTIASAKDPMINTTVNVEVTNIVDKSELETLYNELLGYVKTDYTPDSWAVLEENMLKAYAELHNDKSTNESVAETLANLKAAQAGLVLDFSNRDNVVGDNFGFELGTTEGFGHYPGRTTEGIEIAASDETSHNGTYSGKVVTTDIIQKDPVTGAGYDHKGLMYTIPKDQLEVGTQYDISFWIKAGDDKTHQMGIRSIMRAEKGTGSDEVVTSEYQAVGSEWVKITFRTPVVAENCNRIEIIMGNENTTESAGTYYIDDVEIAKVSSHIAVETVTLDQEKLDLVTGNNTTLKATIAPETATNTMAVWTTTDAAVATVDQNGVVTAVAAGEATIKVTTLDGEKTAECKVTVTDPVVLDSISIDKKPTKTEYVIGENLDLTGLEVTAHYSDGTTKELTTEDYTVSGFNSSVPGEQTIVVVYTENGVETTVTFTVTVVDNTTGGDDGNNGGNGDGNHGGNGSGNNGGNTGSDGTPVKTGDTASAALPIVCGGVSVILMIAAGIIVVRRKRA